MMPTIFKAMNEAAVWRSVLDTMTSGQQSALIRLILIALAALLLLFVKVMQGC